MFRLNRRKKITGQCRFPEAPFDILMSGQQGPAQPRKQTMRVMALVKATEDSEKETTSAEWTGRWDSGDDRYMGAALALLRTATKEIG
jgi:hypothetical protein